MIVTAEAAKYTQSLTEELLSEVPLRRGIKGDDKMKVRSRIN